MGCLCENQSIVVPAGKSQVYVKNNHVDIKTSHLFLQAYIKACSFSLLCKLENTFLLVIVNILISLEEQQIDNKPNSIKKKHFNF